MFLLLVVMVMLVLGAGDSLGTHNSTGGRGKMFNVFQVTNFPNDECTVSDTKVRATRIWEWQTIERDDPQNPCQLPSTINSPQCQELMI